MLQEQVAEAVLEQPAVAEVLAPVVVAEQH